MAKFEQIICSAGMSLKTENGVHAENLSGIFTVESLHSDSQVLGVANDGLCQNDDGLCQNDDGLCGSR